jgi:hypothetical protein
MEIDEKFIKKIARTWKESQYGHYKVCQEKSYELSELLEELYKKVIPQNLKSGENNETE